MKTYTILFAALMLLAVSSNAQSYFPNYASIKKANLEVAAKHYLISLESSNEGVVTSALAQIGRIKLYVPEFNSTELEKKICELSMNGQTWNIRYRAFLICNVFNNTSIFSNESQGQFEDSDALFSALASRLEYSLIGTH